MSKKLGIYTLTDETIKLMKDLVKKTKDEQKEHGFDLCTDMKNDTLKERNICTGGNCEIIRTGQCKENEFLIGGFHTHIWNPEPGLADLVNVVEYGLECIGSGEHSKIDCYTVKDNLKEKDRTRITTDSLKLINVKKEKLYYEDVMKIKVLENEIKSKYVNKIPIL